MVTLKEQGHLCEKDLVYFSTVEFSTKWERERERETDRQTDRQTEKRMNEPVPMGGGREPAPHEYMHKHWTMHSNCFNPLKTLWSSQLGHTSEVCGSFRIVNYQLWVFETASRLWYRAGNLVFSVVLHAETLINNRALGIALQYVLFCWFSS